MDFFLSKCEFVIAEISIQVKIALDENKGPNCDFAFTFQILDWENHKKVSETLRNFYFKVSSWVLGNQIN